MLLGVENLVADPALPVASAKELVALAKASPGKLNYSSAGVGSMNFLAGELFKAQNGIDVVHVSTTLLGQIDAAIGGKCGVNLPEGKNLVGAFWQPAAVICEVMKDDGSMARLPDLEVFAKEHGLKIGTIADLIGYRSRNESLIQRQGSRTLQTPQGSFECHAFRDRSGTLHLALTHGHWDRGDEVLVRVHEPFTALDMLDAGPGGHSWPLPRALAALHAAPQGVAVLLNCTQQLDALVSRLLPESEKRPAARQLDLRTYGVGAQILLDLGVTRMKLLGSPRRMPSMVGYGLEVTGFVAAQKPGPAP